MDITPDEPNPLLEAALGYAAHGIAVFPARLRVRGQNKKDVQPIASWKEASTTDPVIIRSWWGREGAWAGETVCIDTGKSGLIGIDQDISDNKEGPAEWERIGQRSELRVITGSGGYHDYFRADPNHPITVDNTGAVADGVDVRGQGGFLFAPPSSDPRGGSWKWESEPDWDALPDVPRVVIDRVSAAHAGKRAKPTHGDAPQVSGGSQLFASTDYGPAGGWKTRQSAGELLVSELTAFKLLTTEGSGRSHILAQRLGVLAGHGIGVFWSESDAMETIVQACRENGFIGAHTEHYARDQIRRGLEYGQTQPWAEQTVPLTAETLQVAPTAGRLRRALYNRSQLRELPKPMPMIDKTIYRESIVVLSGKFGTYKSFIAVGMACSLATGVPWFGRPVTAAVPVIYAAAEGAYGIGGRIEAWEKKHGIAVPDSLYLIGVSARLNNPADMAELSVLIQETGAQVIVFDTLHASTPGMDENDAGDMGAAVDTLRTLRDLYKVTSILPHHTGHAGQRARGSSSLEDDADTSFVINLEGEDRGPGNVRTMIHRKAKDSRLLEDVALYLEPIVLDDGEESAVVRERTALELIAGTGDMPPAWTAPTQSVPELVLTVLREAGHDRGLTKADVRGIVLQRWYGNEPARLLKQTWASGWNRALQRDEVINVGGERFSADPIVVEALGEISTESN